MAVNDIVMGAAGASGKATYIEDVFSTYLYTGNGTSQTITNGIDLSGKGGLVWQKARGDVVPHDLNDTARGVGKVLQTDSTDGQLSYADLTAFNSNGFTVGFYTGWINNSGQTYASWTFRKQPKFFDIQTWTGNSTVRTIAHNLGSVPGCIIVKSVSAGGNSWYVYHRSIDITTGKVLLLNLTNAVINNGDIFNSTLATSTNFTIGVDAAVNATGVTNIAYLFAHDAGGFGLLGTDNVISCGSFTTDGSGVASVTLGYEPQYLLVKRTNSTSDWFIWDSMRGLTMDVEATLWANKTDVEESYVNFVNPTATGFVTVNGFANSSPYIYIAIRRGPMAVPTLGTSVFSPTVYTGTNVDNRLVNTGILTDMTLARIRNATSTPGFVTGDRLRGNSYLGTALTAAENTDADSLMTPTVGFGNAFSAMNGFGVGNDATANINVSTTASNQLAYAFRRAAGFFDVVCYTGTGVAGRTVTHNLGVVPELMIVKNRQNAGYHWIVYSATLGATQSLLLNTTDSVLTISTFWNNTTPTSSVFSVGTAGATNPAAGETIVAYLFATVAGVSKVGSYTGTGATLNINAGFTTGARFVMIKRTDSTGSWFVWDTTRGMVAGTDPRLAFNLTTTESNANWVYTASSGFQIVTTDASVNASGGSYIYLAVA